MLFFIFILLQMSSTQPLPSSISPCAEVKTLEMSKSLPVWTPLPTSCSPSHDCHSRGRLGWDCQVTGDRSEDTPQIWGSTAMGA